MTQRLTRIAGRVSWNAVPWVAAAFLTGWLASGARTVRADTPPAAQIDVRGIGSESAVIIAYPSLQKVFVYTNPFVGGPARSCAYFFTIDGPGGRLTREQCKPDLRDR
jgi:hypothetical protein